MRLDREDFKAVCNKASAALRVGGVLLMTLKERDSYQEELVDDRFGKRMFYYYNEAIIRELAGGQLEFAYFEHELIKTTPWLYLGLRKT